MKKIIQLIMAILIAIPVMSQSVALQQVTGASPGPVTVDLTMTGFTNVGAITYTIAYDQDLLTYAGSGRIPYAGGTILINSNTSDILKVIWYNNAGANINGTFVTLQFNYGGGFTAPLLFEGLQEITTHLGVPIVATYSNGFVEPAAPVGSALIGVANAIPGANVAVPVFINDLGGLSGIAASIEFHIAIDQTRLSWIGVSDNTLGFTSSYADGVVTLIRTSLTPLVTFPSPILNLNFTYAGGGDAEIAFMSGSEVRGTEGNVLNMAFYDGKVTGMASPTSPLLSIARMSSVEGEEVVLPPPGGSYVNPVAVNLPVFSFGSYPSVGSLALSIAYDDDLLDFKGIDNGPLGSGWTVTHNSGEISIVRSSAGGITMPNGILLLLRFDYYSDLAEVTFQPGTIVTDTEGSPVEVITVDGWITPIFQLNAKVFLQGAWNATNSNMNTALLAAGVIPLTQPYAGTPWNYPVLETVGVIPANVVDWVLVELRSGTAAVTTVDQRAGFVLADGTITDLDGVSPLVFSNSLHLPGDYYIVVKHRNHLAIMSATAQAFSGAILSYDFTDALSKAYDNPSISNDAMVELAVGMYGMWGGDVNSNGTIRYNGPGNDRAAIFSETGNAVISGYLNSDVNMQGQGRYNGPNNDRSAIFNFVGNTVVLTHVPAP